MDQVLEPENAGSSFINLYQILEHVSTTTNKPKHERFRNIVHYAELEGADVENPRVKKLLQHACNAVVTGHCAIHAALRIFRVADQNGSFSYYIGGYVENGQRYKALICLDQKDEEKRFYAKDVETDVFLELESICADFYKLPIWVDTPKNTICFFEFGVTTRSSAAKEKTEKNAHGAGSKAPAKKTKRGKPGDESDASGKEREGTEDEDEEENGDSLQQELDDLVSGTEEVVRPKKSRRSKVELNETLPVETKTDLLLYPESLLLQSSLELTEQNDLFAITRPIRHYLAGSTETIEISKLDDEAEKALKQECAARAKSFVKSLMKLPNGKVLSTVLRAALMGEPDLKGEHWGPKRRKPGSFLPEAPGGAPDTWIGDRALARGKPHGVELSFLCRKSQELAYLFIVPADLYVQLARQNPIVLEVFRPSLVDEPASTVAQEPLLTDETLEPTGRVARRHQRSEESQDADKSSRRGRRMAARNSQHVTYVPGPDFPICDGKVPFTRIFNMPERCRYIQQCLDRNGPPKIFFDLPDEKLSFFLTGRFISGKQVITCGSADNAVRYDIKATFSVLMSDIKFEYDVEDSRQNFWDLYFVDKPEVFGLVHEYLNKKLSFTDARISLDSFLKEKFPEVEAFVVIPMIFLCCGLKCYDHSFECQPLRFRHSETSVAKDWNDAILDTNSEITAMIALPISIDQMLWSLPNCFINPSKKIVIPKTVEYDVQHFRNQAKKGYERERKSLD